MKRTFLLIFPMIALLAQASPNQAEQVVLTSFDTRVQLANAAESDERFKTYRSVMLKRTGRHLARALRSCISSSPKPEKKSVVLVADINAEGKAMAVEAMPDNAVGRCLATGFTSISYPKPPDYPGRQGFPVTMKISVKR